MLIDHSLFPPRLNATAGGELHGNSYRPCDESYSFAPSTPVQNVCRARGGVHERRARVDDRVKAGRDGVAVDERGRAAGERDVVVLDVARVEVRVHAADVKLRVALGELEREDARLERGPVVSGMYHRT